MPRWTRASNAGKQGRSFLSATWGHRSERKATSDRSFACRFAAALRRSLARARDTFDLSNLSRSPLRSLLHPLFDRSFATRISLTALPSEAHLDVIKSSGSLDACDLLYRPTMSLFWERKRALRKCLERNKYRYTKRWNCSIRRIGEINWYFLGEKRSGAGWITEPGLYPIELSRSWTNSFALSLIFIMVDCNSASCILSTLCIL